VSRRSFTTCSHGAIAVAVVALLGASATARGAERIDDFRVKMEKWVETRQILSQEKSDWEAEHAMLEATRDLLRDQRAALKEEIAALETSITEADQERVDLLLARGEYRRSIAAMKEWQAELEQRVLGLVPMLPEPLQDKLEPLIVQIPNDPEAGRVSLGKRLVNVLGVLLQAEKFDGTATLTGETRAIRAGDEQKVQVRTLYWGLGQAVYVDSQGRAAGLGRPGPEGWVFSEAPGLADDAKLLIDIYEGNVDTIRFVDVPVQIQP
jgi:gas vesicle protein